MAALDGATVCAAVIDDERAEEIRLALLLLAQGTPGLLVYVVAHLPNENCFRVADERGETVDLDEHAFWSGELHHWEAYARERLRYLSARAASAT